MTCQMAFLSFEQLKGWTLSAIVDIFLVRQAVKAHPAIVGNPVFFHNFVNPVEDECRLAIIRLHRLIDDFRQARIIPD